MNARVIVATFFLWASTLALGYVLGHDAKARDCVDVGNIMALT